jgi:hypothetical protein
MAKISAHGSIIGTLEYISTAKRYMSDGVVLKNNGFGWKLAGKVKPGIDPAQAFANAERRQREKLEAFPAVAAYRKALHELAGVGKRWKINLAVSTMPDDPDGVWSEACDGYGDNVHADLDELVELCRLYRAALAETKAQALEAA